MTHTYVVSDGYGGCIDIQADSLDEALELAAADAQEHADLWRSEDDEMTTQWVTLRVTREGDEDDEDDVKVGLHPDEPECYDDAEHEWVADIDLVGGVVENPGVHGHGGGVTIDTACARCGMRRTEDSWAQDPSDGVQGLYSIEYFHADEESEIWAAARAFEAMLEELDVSDDVRHRIHWVAE